MIQLPFCPYAPKPCTLCPNPTPQARQALRFGGSTVPIGNSFQRGAPYPPLNPDRAKVPSSRIGISPPHPHSIRTASVQFFAQEGLAKRRVTERHRHPTRSCCGLWVEVRPTEVPCCLSVSVLDVLLVQRLQATSCSTKYFQRPRSRQPAPLPCCRTPSSLLGEDVLFLVYPHGATEKQTSAILRSPKIHPQFHITHPP